jgi:hypothetical protein
MKSFAHSRRAQREKAAGGGISWLSMFFFCFFYLRATSQETSHAIVKNITLKHLHCTDLVGQRFSQRKIRPTGERACKQSTLR